MMANDSKLTPQGRIKPTRRDVDVLGFDFQLAATTCENPRRRRFEQSPSDTLTTRIWRDPDVPENRQITSALQHLQLCGAKCDCRTAKAPTFSASQQQSPLRCVELPGPVQRAIVERVVVFHVWRVEATLHEDKALVRAIPHRQH